MKNGSFLAVGLTRFSVDPLSIIARQHRTINHRYIKELLHKLLKPKSKCAYNISEIRSLLYDDNRLEKRIKLFRRITLQSVLCLANSNVDFQYRVFYSTLLPTKYICQLGEAIHKYTEWCKLVEVSPSQSFFQACQMQIRALKRSSKFFSFRIDDDDALSADYPHHVVEYFNSASTKPILSLPYGYSLCRVSEDKYLVKLCYEPNIAIGLGRLTNAHKATTIFDEEYVHTLLPASKVAYGSNIPSWIRIIHDQNDSGDLINDDNIPYQTSDEVIALLEPLFPFLASPDCLNSIPILSGATPRDKYRFLYGHQ